MFIVMFDGLYDSLANIPANTEGVIEIDFNPFIGWTPNTDSGFLIFRWTYCYFFLCSKCCYKNKGRGL